MRPLRTREGAEVIRSLEAELAHWRTQEMVAESAHLRGESWAKERLGVCRERVRTTQRALARAIVEANHRAPEVPSGKEES